MTETSPRLVHTSRGDTVSYNDRFLYSRRDPLKIPREIASSAAIPPNTLVVIPSPLLFHGVAKLLDRLPVDCHILCVEVDQPLMAFSVSHAPKEIIENENLDVVRTANPAAFTEYMNRLRIHNFRRVIPLFMSGGYLLHKAIYDSLIAAATRHIQRYWQNRITLVHMSRLWIKNIVSNLVRSWRYMGGEIPSSSKPVVVAGAGESLERSLDSLRRYRNRFYLLAVDTALPVLSARNIQPDAVVVLEGQLANAAGFLGHGNQEIPLICDLSAHPSTLDAIRGSKHFVLSAFSSTLLLDRLASTGLDVPMIRPMGSVGVAAVELAKAITTRPVFLTGLDFCYTPGKPHSRGAPSHLRSLVTSARTHPLGLYPECMKRPLLKMKNGRGEQITTDLVLQSYGDDLDEALRTENRFYDLRGGGFPLHSTAIAPGDGFFKILDACHSTGEPDGASRKNGDPPASKMVKNTIRRFLENECLLLTGFLDRVAALETTDTRLTSALNQVDYVYLNFPDADTADRATKQFIVRAAASAAAYRVFLENALQTLG
jgi:hypothetical protein